MQGPLAMIVAMLRGDIATLGFASFPRHLAMVSLSWQLGEMGLSLGGVARWRWFRADWGWVWGAKGLIRVHEPHSVLFGSVKAVRCGCFARGNCVVGPIVRFSGSQRGRVER